MRIVFLGTPEFAVASLDLLCQRGYDIAGVVTAPDKPGGRLGLQQSAVKLYATARDLPVLQPEKLRAPEFLAQLQAWGADLFVVVAFRMLPESVWQMPRLGTMNLHASLLPQYRGAAPINWAIIRGETLSGVTTFLLRHAIDTGDILLQEPMPIGPNETAGQLHDRMMHAGAQLIWQSVQALQTGRAKPISQQQAIGTHAPKITAETGRLDFNRPARDIHNLVRGLSPHPGATTFLEGKTIKIIETALTDLKSSDTPGTCHAEGNKKLLVATSTEMLQILTLKPEGKRQMGVGDFLNGSKITWPTRFSTI
jgi:methionyl-tRNA formyltransferase